MTGRGKPSPPCGPYDALPSPQHSDTSRYTWHTAKTFPCSCCAPSWDGVRVKVGARHPYWLALHLTRSGQRPLGGRCPHELGCDP